MVAVRARPPRTRSFKGDFERGATWAFFVGVRADSRGRAPADARKRVSLSESEKKTPPRGIARPASSVASRTTESESDSESVEKETEKEPRSSSERRSASSRSASAPPPAAPQPPSLLPGEPPLPRVARVRSWGLHREAGAEPGRHPPRGAKTRRSPQSMKPTISFGARRARARTAGREKSPITSPSLVSFTSSFTSSSCDRSSGSGEAAESTPRASSFGIVGRSGVSKGSRQARGSRRSHSRKKTSSPFRSIPKSSRRYETNPSPFFFFDASELEPSNSSKRAQQLPARTTPNASCLAKNAASPASASRAARGGANAPNRNKTRVSRG